MEKQLLKRGLPVVMVICLVLVCTAASYAAPVTVTFTRITALSTVPDSAGFWQFDGGTVLNGTTLVGRYARVKRTVLGGGTDSQNTAMLTITIFLLGADPPETVTLQGSHSFNDGRERGGISAASSAVAGAVGITFEGPDNALTFDVP